MKKWLLSTLALGLTLNAGAEQLQQPYDNMKKQIDIMSNIITSSLSQEQNLRRQGVEIDGFYLKSQGVVFEVGSSRGLSRLINMFGHDNELSFTIDDTMGAVASIPSIAPIVVSGDEEEAITFEVGRSMEMVEQEMASLRDRMEHTNELREEQRELAYEIRSLTRRKRDLDFEMRHADKEDKDKFKQKLEEVLQEMAKLEKKRDALKQRAEKEESVISEKQKKREDKLRKARDSYFAQLDNVIVETLCSYGGGLRKLAKNEHVTFVIDLGNQKKGGADKKIHTFTKKNIVDCVMEEKTPEQLLNSAESYYF